MNTSTNLGNDIDENDYMTDSLTDRKHSRYGSNQSYDNLLYIINSFRNQVLIGSDKSRAKFELNGRRELYNQVSAAYKTARTLLHLTNKDHLSKLLEECGMTKQANKFIKKKETNYWSYVCALLYGTWAEKTDGNDAFLAFERNRSAEKYGNVMRYLYENNVKSDASAMFIETFNDPVHGAGLLGIERADRAAHASSHKKSGKSQVLKHRENLIKLGESPDNSDVFYAIKPDELPDSVEYGRATFKVFGNRLMIVGYEAWEVSEYEKHVINRGRAIKKKEDEIRKSDAKRKEDTLEAAASIAANVKHSDNVYNLIASGAEPDAVARKIAAYAASLTLDDFSSE